MSRENVELAQAGIATVNDAYRTGDVLGKRVLGTPLPEEPALDV